MWCLAKCFLIFTFVIYTVIRLISKLFKKNLKAIAFFHPYANAGGGGERVLWQSVKCLQKNYPDYEYYILTGDLIDEEQLMKNVENSFKIKLIKPIKCIKINSRFVVEAKYHKVCTLLSQSLASIVLAIECLIKINPNIIIDTMGYAFTYWLFSLFKCKVISYTHYPTISTDMLEIIIKSEDTFNNRPLIARSKFLTLLKLIYYRIFAYLYGRAGKFADIVMVNSSWTLGHINEIWKIPDRTHLVYPPCNTDSYLKLPINNSTRNKYQILSLAQFRPEKNHKLQIQIIERLLNKFKTNQGINNLKLVLVGSVRDQSDQIRVDNLKNLIKSMNVEKNVEFKLNISFDEILKEMSRSSIGLHTMINEHFGIAIVESLAAGLIMIAHNSAGPKMDIIEHETNGYLASNLDEYVQIISNVFSREGDLNQIRQNAKDSSTKFSDHNFDKLFLSCVKKIFK